MWKLTIVSMPPLEPLEDSRSVYGHNMVLKYPQSAMCTRLVLPTLLYSAETYTTVATLENFLKVYLRHLRQILRITWKDHIPNVEVLRRANMSSIDATLTATQLRWTGHITRMNDNRLPQAVFYGGISQRETSSWWTTAAIQRCSQTTHKGYTHRDRHLGGSCTRSTTLEAGNSQRKESYWRKYITKIPTWSQSPPRLPWCFCPYHLLCHLQERLFSSDWTNILPTSKAHG